MSYNWTENKEREERRQNSLAKANEILIKAKKENRNLTPEEDNAWESHHKDADAEGEMIAKEKRQAQAEATETRKIGRDIVETSDKKNTDDIATRAWEKWFRKGQYALTLEERSAMDRRSEEYRTVSGMGVATAGSELVPQSFALKLIEQIKYYGGVREVATTWTTSSGSDMPIPTLSDISNTGELLGINTATTDDHTADPATSDLTLKTYMFSSKVVRVPLQLMQDSAFPVDSWLPSQQAIRLARITNYYNTLGDGNGQPYGLATQATAGKVGAANQAVSYNELIDLETSLDIAYWKNAKFMFHQTTLGSLKKLVDDQHRPLWNGGNVAMELAPSFDNKPYVINNDMAELTTAAGSNKAILFGDYSYYIIHDSLGVQLMQLRERYAEYLQVGFISFLRSGGLLSNTSAVKYFITKAGS